MHCWNRWIAAATLVYATTASAGVVVGALSRATASDVIVDSLNQREWLGFDVTIGFNYAQALAATEVGGRFEGFRIATISDAGKFAHAVSGTPCTVRMYGGSLCFSGALSLGLSDLVGESGGDTWATTGRDDDVALFLGDTDVTVGLLAVRDVLSTNLTRLEASGFAGSIAVADQQGELQRFGWMMYRDVSATAISEPTSLALGVAGLIAAAAVRSARRRG